MIGTLIGGGIGALGSVVGAIGSARKMKQAGNMLTAQHSKLRTKPGTIKNITQITHNEQTRRRS